MSKKIYSCNDDFFSSYNERNLYWAGFLAADGSVRKTTINSRVLNLTLANKDREHLELFKKHISSNSKIFEIKSGNSNCGRIDITSSKIFEDLNNYNIVPRKTLIYQFPEWLIDHPSVHHFMRGYIDGDGCFRIRYRGKCKNLHVYLSLRGTESFLRVFKNILEDKCKLSCKISIIYDCATGKIEYGGNSTTSKIVEFLYKDATVYLERKYNIALNSLINNNLIFMKGNHTIV